MQRYHLRRKQPLYLIGLLTLVIFPLVGATIAVYAQGLSIKQWLQLHSWDFSVITFGGIVGVIYAIGLLFLSSLELFPVVPDQIEQWLKRARLSVFDAFFLSACAGLGEELFFRAAIQAYTGPFWGAVLFVAVHGYLNPFRPKQSVYGLLILPLAMVLSCGYEHFGLWFSVGCHFAYDLVLFLSLSEKFKEQSPIASDSL